MLKTCLHCKCRFDTNETWKTLCINCYKSATNFNNYNKPKLKIDDEMLKRMIYLCHPDKHNQSEASVIVTKYLLTLK